MCRLSWNLGASTSRNPQGLSRPVMGLLYVYPVAETLSGVQASSTVQLRLSLFWNDTRCRLVVGYRRFGTIYRSHLQGSRRVKAWNAVVMGAEHRHNDAKLRSHQGSSLPHFPLQHAPLDPCLAIHSVHTCVGSDSLNAKRFELADYGRNGLDIMKHLAQRWQPQEVTTHHKWLLPVV